MKMNRTLAGLAVVILGLSALYTTTWSFPLGRPVLSVPDDIFVDSYVTFTCQLPETPTEEMLITFFREEDNKKFGETTMISGFNISQITIQAKIQEEGYIRCKVETQNKTNVEAVVSKRRYFRVSKHMSSVELLSFNSTDLFEGDKLLLICNALGGVNVNILYKWSLNNKPLNTSSKSLVIEGVTQRDEGTYMCVASSGREEHSSNAVVVRVKEKISKPEISFVVYKLDNQYWVNITCQTASGSPPLNFTINSNLANVTSEFVTEQQSLHTQVVKPFILGKSTFIVRCSISNAREEISNDLKVVRVGGAVSVQPEYDVGSNFEVVGLTLHCVVEQGNISSYYWFVNGSKLPEEPKGDFYKLSEERRTLAFTSLQSYIFGIYHCEVKDMFGTNSSIISKEFLVDQKALKHVPFEVVALVTGCCILLLSLLIGCYVYGTLHSNNQPTKQTMLNWAVTEAEARDSEDGDELIEDEYEDDLNLVKSTKLDEPEEFDVESLDEWQELQKILQISSTDEDSQN